MMDRTVYLDSDTASIQHLCRKDRRFARVFSLIGPISYTVHSDGYSFLVREIIEQMLSTKAAAKIYSRLNALCGGSVAPETVSALSDEEIRSIGTSRGKVRAIRSLTDAVTSGRLDPESLGALSDDAVMQNLTSVHGIGAWTAKMYLIFVLDRQNILPFEDGAFLQSYRWMYKTEDSGPKAVQAKCRKWRPYASIAARYLYRALDSGLTKTEFHLFKDPARAADADE